MVDALDLALLRQFGLPFDGVRREPSDFRAAALARRLGSTPPTVRERLERMRDAGFLLGFVLVPNPALGAERFLVAYYRIEQDSDDRLLRAMEVEGTQNVIRFGGGRAIVMSTARDEVHARERICAQERVLGVPPVWHALDPHLRRDPPPMTPLDWRVFEALQLDALRSLDEVALDVGVTRRTVKTRLDRMLREACVYLLPVLDRTRLPGAIHHWIHAAVEPGRKAAIASAVRALLEERCLAIDNPPTDPGHLIVNAWSRTPGEAEEVRLLLAGIAGVRSTETLVILHVR